MFKENVEIAVTYVAYLIYLIASVGCFWLMLSTDNAFFFFCLLIVSLVGIIVCILKLLENREQVEMLSAILPKKIRRKFRKIYNKWFKEGYI
jgi:hypothetical protein